LTASKYSKSANTTGRLGGLASDDDAPDEVTGRIVRDPLLDFSRSAAEVQSAFP